ncbi:MAG: ABC transporter ATP-binding protein [Clostridiales bacterium]|jgi:ABC-2 type transport system ATP-binding protein|nr:ABC transporter ATP-binding protein [Clostridiales bacterium]
MNLPILECRNLSKSYGQSDLALNNFNIALPKGKVIGLLGPNGSGKTTLIKLIAGLLTPTSGELLVNGMPVGVETKRIVSYLPERTYFDPGMRVEETIQYFEDFYKDFDTEKARAMLQDLGIDTNKKMKALSKGTKEKVQLVLVMSRDAGLYLLDEPIGGVDPATRDYILNTIVSNYNPDSTVLISTHLISDVEKVLDEFMFIHNGALVMYNSADNVREELGKGIDELFREVFRC